MYVYIYMYMYMYIYIYKPIPPNINPINTNKTPQDGYASP